MSPDILTLALLALPVACIARTVTQEDIFKELREYCAYCSKTQLSLLRRKFFYLFTCEYCFSHWVTMGMLWLSDFHLLYPGWRGLLVAGFSLVWVANVYLGLFAWLKLKTRHERLRCERLDHLHTTVVIKEKT